MLPTALVPVRFGPGAKGRLAHVLGPRERVHLVRTLLEGVVSVLGEAGLPTVVLSPRAFEAPPGTEVWTDEAEGLNRAVDAAVARLGAPVLIIHADLPCLRTDDIDAVLASSADVVVARARDGGTNGLLLRHRIRPVFGPGSALLHAARAHAQGLRTHVIDTPGFAWDVDDETGLSASGACAPRGTRP